MAAQHDTTEEKPNAALKEAQAAQAAGKAVAKDGDWEPAHPCRGINRILDAEQGTVELLMPDGVTPRKKFALVGFAGGTRSMAPFGDPEWAVVGMNQLNRHIPRADAWFEIHKEWNTAVVPGTDHEGWLRDCGLPVYMAYRVPGLPTSLGFPLPRMVEKFNDYFTSTVAYMLAWAIDHIDRLVEDRMRDMPVTGTLAEQNALARSLYKEYMIGLFGIDLIVGSEYFEQKPCAEFWIGQACGRGIDVAIPPQSALCTQGYRYGYEMEPQGLIRPSDFDKRRAALQAQHQEHSAQAIRFAGMLEENEYMAELMRLRSRGGSIKV